ncbi:hypothetical protein [Microbacterium thalassium]|uniref:Uncharacterized protein n=1 Tax=Microbacterium thalassium TaxID=362649 RepID=A0A7X0FM12_9MICO|nr:hypothetical protein [Microbacterium thalassium]MBB6389982.1 hypothetical protein [Microbacterium thalassium]GLK24668.1 hypothetical protein GCM10017607_19860 [Microbacterium thalassium]
MKSARLPRVVAKLPRRGYVLATLTVVDENGFTHHYAPVETPLGALRDAAALMHLQSTAMDTSHDDARSSAS